MIEKIHNKYIKLFQVDDSDQYLLLLFKLFIFIQAFVTSPVVAIYSYIEGDYFLSINLIILTFLLSFMLYLLKQDTLVRLLRHFYLFFAIDYIFLIYNFQNGGILNTPLSWVPLIVVIIAIIARSSLSFIAHILFFLISNIILELYIIKNSIEPFELKYVSIEFIHTSSFVMAAGSFLIFFYSIKILLELYIIQMKSAIDTRVQLNHVLRKKVEIPLTQAYVKYFSWGNTINRRESLTKLINSIIRILNNVRFMDKLSSKKEILCVDMELISSDIIDLWENKLSELCGGSLEIEGDLGLNIFTNENNYNSYIVANIMAELRHLAIKKIKISIYSEPDLVVIKIQIKLIHTYIMPSNFLLSYDNMFKDLSLIENGFTIAQLYAENIGLQIDYQTDKEKNFIIKSIFKNT